MTIVDAFLEHHGVKGMKWGIRNEERTQGIQARREKHAQKYERKAEKIQKELDRFNSMSFKDSYSRSAIEQRKDYLTKQKKQALDDAELKRQGKLSSKNKKVLIGAGIAAGLLAAYGTYTLAESGELRRSIEKRRGFSFKKNPELSSKDMDVDSIMSKVVHGVNPDFGAVGTKTNCRRCSFAYEMRRRGYDVSATRTISGRGADPTGFYNATHPEEKHFVPAGRLGMLSKIVQEHRHKLNPEKPFTEMMTNHPLGEPVQRKIGENYGRAIFRDLKNYPDGSRGEIGISYGPGGGHSLAWEIIHGKPVVFDTQRGEKYLEGELEKDPVSNYIVHAGINRLDDKSLNESFLLRWLKNR